MKPSEHKTVQARILAYAEAIGWTIVSREEAEQRRGFDPEVPPADRAKNLSLFFGDLLDPKNGKIRTLRGGRLVPDLLTFRALTCQKEVSKDE